MKYPNFAKEHKSLMAKYLTKEMFEELKDLKTSNGFTLEKAIKSGIDNPDSGIGIYAGDEESYSTFKALFDPIIQEYHGFLKEDKHKRNLNADELIAPNLDLDGKYIVSTRIRVGRNLADFPLGPSASKEQRDEVEKIVSLALLLHQVNT